MKNELKEARCRKYSERKKNIYEAIDKPKKNKILSVRNKTFHENMLFSNCLYFLSFAFPCSFCTKKIGIVTSVTKVRKRQQNELIYNGIHCCYFSIRPKTSTYT